MFASKLEILDACASDIRSYIDGSEGKAPIQLAGLGIPHEQVVATAPACTGGNHKVAGEVHLLASVVRWILKAPKICTAILPGIAEVWKLYIATLNLKNGIILEAW